MSEFISRLPIVWPIKRNWSIRRVLAVLLIVAGAIAGGLTYGTLSTISPGVDAFEQLNRLFFVDLAILLALAALVGTHIFRLMQQRRQGLAGASLHVQLAAILGVLTLVPTILVTIFSLLFFHYGLQTWFSDQVKTAIVESRLVAESYLSEHQQAIRADILAMANDLDREAPSLIGAPKEMTRFINTQTVIRNLSEALVFTGQKDIVAQSLLTFSLAVHDVPKYALDRARSGEVVVYSDDDEEDDDDDQVRAIIKLNAYPDTYLVVGRAVDSNVLGRVASTKEAAAKYDQLEQFTSQIKRSLTGLFATVAVVLLLIALWFGLILSQRLIAPIEALISAAERVRAGDLAARLPESGYPEEFLSLARSFNRMTSQLATQRDNLIAANLEMDERRRLTEAILAGVSSGVLSLDSKGQILHSNSAAQNILGQNGDALYGQPIDAILPEFDADKARAGQIEITLKLADLRQRAITLRATDVDRKAGDNELALIVTFDDITALKTAQRASAWGDVARRIAHEIKNPLTPIQLSAERLERRYADVVPEEGRTVFRDCVQTIIRHVQDIGAMVAEFSQFGRMPQPVFQPVDLTKLVSDLVTFQKQAYPKMGMSVSKPAKPIAPISADDGQLRQAVTNILKNALESIGDASAAAEVKVEIVTSGAMAAVVISDNGPGFPPNVSLEQLTEPYVTHKSKGTGLGLAIVKKIMEDHGGELILGASPWLKKLKAKPLSGAVVTLLLPLKK
jgi:two-component system nitrogen regulation sensor histidine kinase NtrY